jgi:preprotein translocase subunit YajC
MLTSILLMAGSPDGKGGSSQFLITMLLIMVVFYFFMIRPQTQKAKKEREFKDAIKKGDKVVTIGGIHGKIAEIADKTFLFEVDGGVRMKIEKSSISAELTKAAQQE